MVVSKALALREFEAFVRPVRTLPLIMHTLWKILKALVAGEGTVRCALLSTAVGHLLQCELDEQVEIGWSQVLKGRFSGYWRKAQEQFYVESHQGSETLTGRRWLIGLTRGMWRIMNRQWKTRCKKLHDAAKGINREEIWRSIKDYYRNPHLRVTAEDIDLFCLPLQMRLEQSAQMQRLWLKTVEIAHSARRTEEREALHGAPDISTFFVHW